VPVAQLDRALDSGSKGRRFKSSRAYKVVKMRKIFIFLFFLGLGFSKSKKEKIIESFLDARYSGDTLLVRSMVSDTFIYKHTPYIGLEIATKIENENLIVAGIINNRDSISNSFFSVGDTIHEINNNKINQTSFPIKGPLDKSVKFIVTKNQDSIFTENISNLKRIEIVENISSYLIDISNYNNMWYEFELEIIDILTKKNTSMVYYIWRGQKSQDGYVYEFYRMEYIQIDKKTGLINSVEGLWSQNQFLDQLE
tara:strand:+ start:1241 stop:2002 length:762 start_codon:yes stop_codon:yes gene_type:complete